VSPTKLRVLYVEEPSRQRDEVVTALDRHNVVVKVASSSREATSALARPVFDVVVIDGALRDAVRWIAGRANTGTAAPILLLCGFDDHRQIRAGYRAGATLCLPRPIRGDVLAYHLHGLLAAREPREIRFGKLSLDPFRRVLALPGRRKLTLPPQEFVLLHALARELGEHVSHRDLIDRVWSNKPLPPRRTDLPGVVLRLRKLLGDHAWMLRSVHGFGYVLSADRFS
jgi:DNA-binding response OmpR family regulator